MSTIAIIDYGMGNLHSIAKAIQHVTDDDVQVTAVPEQILAADRVVFPGVGAIRDCMHELKRLALDKVIIESAHRQPFLGICLGMQAIVDHSDENEGVECLGIIPGNCRHFDLHATGENGEPLKVPHMGWNQVHQETGHPLWQGIEQDSRVFFVHSYHVLPDNDADCAGSCRYPNRFAAAIARDNLFAVQFHPEKSQHAGLQLLKNFTRWNGEYNQS